MTTRAESLPRSNPFEGLHVNIAEVNARLEKYRPLIKENHKTQTIQNIRELSLGTPISRNFFTPDNTYVSAFADVLRGRALVDIGAGYASDMRKIAKKFGVPFLIEIEKFFGNVDTEWEDVLKDELHIIRFHGDMLETLARLPDAFGNVVMNGIDRLVVPSGGYRQALFEEVTRIVPPSGIFFGYDSDIAADSRYRDPMPTGFTRSPLDDKRNTNGKLTRTPYPGHKGRKMRG